MHAARPEVLQGDGAVDLDCRDKGAPPAGGSQAGYHQAACNYYGACADGSANYAAEVMARAKLYGFVGRHRHRFAGLSVGGADPVRPGYGGVAIAAGDGEFIVDPGANRPGVDLAPELVGFIRRMAEFLPRPPIGCSRAWCLDGDELVVA